jgi:DNA-binding NtrC family response regulator
VVVLDPQGRIGRELQQMIVVSLEFHCVDSVADARKLLSRRPCSVGLVMLESPPVLAQEEVEALVASTSMTEWIALVAPAALTSAAAQRFVLGACYDYHSLPIDPQRLVMTIGHACGKARLRLSLHGKQNRGSGRFGIYGASAAMQTFFQQLEKVVDADLAVLIGGETGTGKELVAQAIHKHSARAAGPFVVVNCGAVPEHLIQSELFGHEKGAFTGALQRKIGSIEAAAGGDLFLDEIGDLPLSMQANLLRVLQERTITRIGSTQPIAVDFRIIAATHVDLHEAVRAGRFRKDLYYRLNVVHLDLPPLRQREGDVLLLADAIFRRYAAANRNCRAKGFSSQALRAMSAYPWPGNVRELINRIHRAVILSDNRLVSAADLSLDAYAEVAPAATLEDARASFDRSIVENCLRNNANNVSRTARQLGVSRVTLYRMMNKHNVAPAAEPGTAPNGPATG